jgi:hypothetical protein
MAQKKTISYLLLAARVLRVVEQRIHEQLDKSGGIEEQLLVLIADREVQNALTVPCFHRAHPPDWMAMVRCLQKCVCFNFCYVCPEPVLAYIQFFSLKWHTQKTFLHLHDLIDLPLAELDTNTILIAPPDPRCDFRSIDARRDPKVGHEVQRVVQKITEGVQPCAPELCNDGFCVLRSCRGKTVLFFGVFPNVCPEPVLVKCSFLYTDGSKRPILLTVEHTFQASHPGIPACETASLFGVSL